MSNVVNPWNLSFWKVSHVPYKECRCRRSWSLIYPDPQGDLCTRGWLNYHQERFHWIVLWLNVPKISHSGSDCRSLSQCWLFSCLEPNHPLASCRKLFWWPWRSKKHLHMNSTEISPFFWYFDAKESNCDIFSFLNLVCYQRNLKSRNAGGVYLPWRSSWLMVWLST